MIPNAIIPVSTLNTISSVVPGNQYEQASCIAPKTISNRVIMMPLEIHDVWGLRIIRHSFRGLSAWAIWNPLFKTVIMSQLTNMPHRVLK